MSKIYVDANNEAHALAKSIVFQQLWKDHHPNDVINIHAKNNDISICICDHSDVRDDIIIRLEMIVRIP